METIDLERVVLLALYRLMIIAIAYTFCLSCALLKFEPHHDKNLFSGFATRVDSNRPAQPQKLGRGLIFFFIETRSTCIKLSKQRITKVLIRLRGCAS